VTSAPAPLHHYLPKFYLRAFADERKRVTVTDRATGEETTDTIRRLLAEPGYYTVRSDADEEDHQLIEGIYQRFESQGAPVHAAMLADEYPPSDTQRERWAAFMALQMTRGPAFRAWMSRTTDEFGKMTLRQAARAPDSYWKHQHAEWAKTREGPEPPPSLTRQQRRWLTEGDRFDVRPSREHVIEMSFEPADTLASLYYAMDWRLVRFPEPCLLTSDNPITYWKRAPATYGTGMNPVAYDEVRMPLSPTQALVLTPPESDENETIYDCGRDVAALLNWNTLRSVPCTQYVRCPDVKHHPLPTPAQLTARQRRW
jgi:hypothetical protein